MNQVAIVTDSTAYLPPELIAEYKINVIPLVVIWDGDSFEDGVDITPTQFYTRLAKSPSLPSTSQPSEAKFVEIFSNLLKGELGCRSDLDLIRNLWNRQFCAPGQERNWIRSSCGD